MNYKTMILPIIAALCIFLKLITGIEIDEAIQAQIAEAVTNVILVGFIIYGIVKNHKEDKVE